MILGEGVITGLGGGFSQTALNGSLIAALAVSLIAGLVSFASPCVVPLVPAYLGYVSGMAGADSTGKASRPRLALGALLFVLGFASVFVVLSVVFVSLGAQLEAYVDTIVRILGVLVIVLGFVFMGAIPFMQTEKRMHLNPRAGLIGAPLLGVTFGLGWTPCIGPTLAAVLTLGLTESTQGRGIALAIAYSLGLGLPFLALALWMERSQPVLAWLRRHRLALMRIGGTMLVILGVLLVTGLWGQLTAAMQGWIDSVGVAV